MKIKAVSVRVFELFTLDGTSMGLFKVESDWHGLRELRSLDNDEKVIVDASETAVDRVFGEVFGEHRAEVTVIKASPDFALRCSNG